MKQSSKKSIIIFFSILLITGVLCIVQFMYHSFKTPKIEKKSHTLYGFLITDKNQERLPVTATIDFDIGTYPFHNKETSIQGKITVSYAQKEIYTTDFYSHNLERKYISIEDISNKKVLQLFLQLQHFFVITYKIFFFLKHIQSLPRKAQGFPYSLLSGNHLPFL